MRALQYSFAEALASLKRSRQSGLLSTATIALALFVLGSLLHHHGESRASRRGMEQLRRDVRVPRGRDYRRAAASDRKRARARRDRGGRRSTCPRKRRWLGSSRRSTIWPGRIDTLGDNPLPASYEVRLNPGAATEAGIDELGARLRETCGRGRRQLRSPVVQPTDVGHLARSRASACSWAPCCRSPRR